MIVETSYDSLSSGSCLPYVDGNLALLIPDSQSWMSYMYSSHLREDSSKLDIKVIKCNIEGRSMINALIRRSRG